VQAITFNIPRRQGPFDLVVIAISIAGPIIASFMLWNARAARGAS